MEFIPHAITNLYAAADALVAVCVAVLGIVIYVGRRTPRAFNFAVTIAAMCVWAVSASQMYSADSASHLLAWTRLNYFTGGLIMATFYLFARSIPKEGTPLNIKLIVWSIQAVLAYIYLGTNAIIATASLPQEALSSPLLRVWTLGDYSWISLFNFGTFLVLGAQSIYRAFSDQLLATDPDHYTERLRMFQIALIGMIPTAALTVLLPRFDIYSLQWFGPVVLFTWICFILYALIRYKFLSIRFSVTEIAILTFIALLFLSIIAPVFVEGIRSIPTSLTLSLFNIFTIILGSTIVILLLFAIILWRQGTSRESRLMLYITLLFATALAGGIVYYDTDTSFPNVIVIGSRSAFFFGFSTSLAFLYIVTTFGLKEPLSRNIQRLRTFLIGLNCALLPIQIFSPLVIIHTIIPENITEIANRNPHFNPYAILFFTLPYALSMLLAGAIVVYRAVTEKDERLRRHLRNIAILSWLFLIPTGLIHAFEVLYPTILETTFMPFTGTAWILGVLYFTLRHEIDLIRTLVPVTIVFVLLGGLFFGVFVDLAPDLYSLHLRELSQNSPYVLINWLVAFVFGVIGLYIFIKDREPISKPYAYLLFSCMQWALGVGAFYLTYDEGTAAFWLRHNHVLGALPVIIFCYFTLHFTEHFKSRLVYWSFVVSQGAIAAIALTTSLVVIGVSVSPSDVLDRVPTLGPLNPLIYVDTIGCFLIAAWALWNDFPRLHPETRALIHRVVRFTVIGLLPGIIIMAVTALLGYTHMYWIVTTAILGMVAVSSYPLLTDVGMISKKVFFAEIGAFVFISLLFGVVILPQDIALNFLSRFSVFIAFSVVAGFFIGTVVSGEERREELETITTNLTSLNSSLAARITERTSDLQNATAHTETVIETFTHGLLEFDDLFTLIRINKSAERMLGISRFAFLGQQVLPELRTTPQYSSLASVSYPALAEHSERISSRSVGITAEAAVHIVTVTHPEPAELQVITAPIIDENGKTIGFIKVIRDITRERLIARSKSEFISIAAHQLRTPLSIIRWSISVLLSGDQGPLEPLQNETLSKAEETNNRMIELVNDLLDVARIEEGKLVYAFAPNDLIATLRTVTENLRPFAEHQKVSLTFGQPATPFPQFTFDAQRISRALVTIIDNALRYTHPGGSVTVHVASRSEWAEIIVRDTGISVPKEQIPRLFTKFFRAENAIRTAPDGFGLGLYIAKNFIVRHGGTIDVESDTTLGTVVTIRLPLDASKIPVEANPIEESGLELIEGRL